MQLVISARATAVSIEIEVHGHAGSHASGRKVQPLVNAHIRADLGCHPERTAEVLLEVIHRVSEWLCEEAEDLPDAEELVDLL